MSQLSAVKSYHFHNEDPTALRIEYTVPTYMKRVAAEAQTPNAPSSSQMPTGDQASFKSGLAQSLKTAIDRQIAVNIEKLTGFRYTHLK
jgi:hypothetical protein